MAKLVITFSLGLITLSAVFLLFEDRLLLAKIKHRYEVSGIERTIGSGPLPVAADIQVNLDYVADGFSQPIRVTHADDESGWLFVVERAGVIKIIKNGSVLPRPFLGIQSFVESNKF